MLNILKYPKKHHLLLRYLLTSFIIFMLPFLLFSFIMINNSVKKFNQEIESSYHYKLKQISGYMDTQYENMQICSVKISYDTYLKPYRIMNNSYDEIEAVREMKKYKDTVFVADECMFFLKGHRNVYASSGKYTDKVFLADVLGIREWDRVINELEECQKPFLMSRKAHSSDDGSEKEIIIAAYPVSTDNTFNSDAVVVYFINSTSFDNAIKNLVGEVNGELQIYNRKGERMLNLFLNQQEQNKMIATELPKEFVNYDEQNIVKFRNFDEEFSIFKSVSVKMGLSYILAMPTADYLEKAKQLTHTMNRIGFAALILGVMLAVLVSFSNYQPIYKLVKSINRAGLQEKDKKDMGEIESIDSVIRTTISANEKLLTKIDEQDDYIRDQTLISILKGNDIQTLKGSFNHIQLNLNGPYFCVLVLSIINESKEDAYYVKGQVMKRIQQIYSIEKKGYGVELAYDNYIALVCNLTEGTKIERYELAGKLLKDLNDSDMKVRIGVGNACNQVENINSSFIGAVAAIEFEKSTESIVLFDNIVCLYSYFEWYPSEEVIRYIQSLKQGEEQIALSNLQNIVKNIKEKNISKIMEKYICYEIIKSLMSVVKEMNLPLEPQHYNSLIILSTIDQMYESLSFSTVCICKLIKERIHHSSNKLMAEIVAYINENYLNYDISLSSLAEKFNITDYALSKIFKLYLGVGFKEYIIKLRIEKSKTLLMSSQLSVKEIAEMVGYSDTSHFIKTFKGMEGVTPVSYRENFQS